GYLGRAWACFPIRAHASAAGICAHSRKNILFRQALFSDSLSVTPRPELLTRQLGAFSHGLHLFPTHVWGDSVSVSAIGAGDDVLTPHDPGVGQDAIRDQFGGFYGRCLVSDDPRDVDLALGKLDFFPEFPI